MNKLTKQQKRKLEKIVERIRITIMIIIILIGIIAFALIAAKSGGKTAPSGNYPLLLFPFF
jgi:hypothetical protein